MLFTIHRVRAGAERSFYRALKERQHLQTERQLAEGEVAYTENGFVPQNGEDRELSADHSPLPAQTTETEPEFVQ